MRLVIVSPLNTAHLLPDNHTSFGGERVIVHLVKANTPFAHLSVVKITKQLFFDFIKRAVPRYQRPGLRSPSVPHNRGTTIMRRCEVEMLPHERISLALR